MLGEILQDSDSDFEEWKPSNVLSERQVEVSDEEDNWIPSPVKAQKQKLASKSTKV